MQRLSEREATPFCVGKPKLFSIKLVSLILNRGFKKGVLRKPLAKIRLNLSAIRRKKVLRKPTPVVFEPGPSTIETQWSYHKTTEQTYQINGLTNYLVARSSLAGGEGAIVKGR